MLKGTSKNRRYSSDATKLPSNDSASFPFRFIDVHALAARDRYREQFFEVPLSLMRAFLVVPDAAWTVSRTPSMLLPGRMARLRFWRRLIRFRCVSRGLLALVSLIHTWRGHCRAFYHNVHHRGFWPKQLMAVWSLPLQGDSEGPTFISRTAWRFRRFRVFL